MWLSLFQLCKALTSRSLYAAFAEFGQATCTEAWKGQGSNAQCDLNAEAHICMATASLNSSLTMFASPHTYRPGNAEYQARHMPVGMPCHDDSLVETLHTTHDEFERQSQHAGPGHALSNRILEGDIPCLDLLTHMPEEHAHQPQAATKPSVSTLF